MLDEMLQDSPAEDDLVTGSAANLIPEPEPEKTPEPEGPEDEGQDEPEEEEWAIENQEINTPTRRQETQETRAEREITEKINTPPAEDTQVARAAENVEELRLEPWPLDGSTATEVTRRKSSRVSIPTDRYSAEFKRPGAPRSRRGAKA